MGDELWKLKGFEVDVGVAGPNPNGNGWVKVDGLLGTDPVCCPNERGGGARVWPCPKLNELFVVTGDCCWPKVNPDGPWLLPGLWPKLKVFELVV